LVDFAPTGGTKLWSGSWTIKQAHMNIHIDLQQI